MREKSLCWSNSLKEVHFEVDLDDVTSHSSKEAARIIWGDHDALVNSLDLAHLQVSEENLLLLVINIPYTKAVVVDGHKFLVGVVKECNLVRNIHTNGVSTDSFSTSNLI